MIRFETIPETLRSRNQWVLWRTVQRDKPTTVPFGTDGTPAKANDPSTWCGFDDALAVYNRGGYDGIGYEFSKDDPFVGIDLDGCRDPESGEIQPWARDIIVETNTYAEVSPSQSGVKLFVTGKLPFDSGRKLNLERPKIGNKQPAIEVYEHGRYFAVTGLKLTGLPAEPEQRNVQLAMLCERYWPQAQRAAAGDFYAPQSVVERARKYLAKCPPSVSGQSGHNAAFHVACILLHGFQLERDQAIGLMREWNQTCQPPWSDRELEHKIDSATKQPGERGYLRNARPQTWDRINIPNYESKKGRRKPGATTLVEATQRYIDRMKDGVETLIETGIPELDYALGGGVELGEMVIAAARPSHGKSAFALQAAHHWTSLGLPTLVVSEEMSALALGKRTLQFITELPQEQWNSSPDQLERELAEYKSARAPCLVSEACVTPQAVVEAMEEAVEKHQVQAVVIDYAQLLQGKGGSRYEQVSFTSNTLREAASRLNVVMLTLCQLNREVEKRQKFIPCTADIRDAGTLEQDADVILLLAWPFMVDRAVKSNLYQVFVAKNRNRPINQALVSCRFDPARQMITESTAREMANFHDEFDSAPNFDPFGRD
jgi:KaiC/GvpD/RAD55 family RecA-like ATPase